MIELAYMKVPHSWGEFGDRSAEYLHEKTPLDISTGRQLFVDDFLIESTTLSRTYHRPYRIAQVLSPETELEMNRGHCPVAAPFNDGVWFDPHDNLFKLWYHAGWFDGTALATSSDGFHWNRPNLEVVPGTNAVVVPGRGRRRDGGLVWRDHHDDENKRYKMFQYYRWPGGQGGEVSTSPDGIHWSPAKNTSPCGDNTSFYYNPFRKTYVFSIRKTHKIDNKHLRVRYYYEGDTFLTASQWAGGGEIPWYRADEHDRPDPEIGDDVQLYDLNVVAYESLLIGACAMFYGPQNEVCARLGMPKRVDLHLAYSRNGFHWLRPDRRGFITGTGNRADWNRGYIHAAGGLFCVTGDTLLFYFGAFSGDSPVLQPGETGEFEQDNAMYAGGSTGVAVLRRDGFASMDGTGELTTKQLTHQGSYLYVNCNGFVRAEVLDEMGKVIIPFSLDNCRAERVNATCVRISWRGAEDLSTTMQRRIMIRFAQERGQLYAFWITPFENGESSGYVAAGGPGISGSTDIPT